jgi:hypothetical protein
VPAQSGIGDTKSNNDDGAINGSGGVDGDVVNTTMKKRDHGGQRI